MDEQVTHRLWRSSMGCSEVIARWPVIIICTLVGSAVSDMIAMWIKLRHVDGDEPKGWIGGLARCTLIEEEVGETSKQGLQ
jgi:hypothetical protein